MKLNTIKPFNFGYLKKIIRLLNRFLFTTAMDNNNDKCNDKNDNFEIIYDTFQMKKR